MLCMQIFKHIQGESFSNTRNAVLVQSLGYEFNVCKIIFTDAISGVQIITYTHVEFAITNIMHIATKNVCCYDEIKILPAYLAQYYSKWLQDCCVELLFPISKNGSL